MSDGGSATAMTTGASATGLALGRAVDPAADRPDRGVRVVLDARPLQDPDHAPVTAAYLDGLLRALDAEPLRGETFVFLLAAELPDPTDRYPNLEVVGRRLLPPVRLLGAARPAVDPFVVRGAVTGAAWRPERTGSAGAVHHTTGAALPLASELPVVAALLDLAPWELPALRRRRGPAGFGRRLRARLVGEAAAVIVGTESIGRRARRLLHLEPDRVHVIPLAPAVASPVGSEAARLGLAASYVAVATRFDARHDTATLVAAIAMLEGLEARKEAGPFAVVVGATPEDRASIARLAAARGVSDALAYAPALPPGRQAALLAGARAVVVPALADAAGLAVIDALALGVPVVASSVGALPELVGPAGILVPPANPSRLVAALRIALGDDASLKSLAAAAEERGRSLPAWSDVAWATRAVWSGVARRPRLR